MFLLKDLAKLVKNIYLIFVQLATFSDKLERIQEAIGRIELRQLIQDKSKNIHHNEFQVFSQWGEDGIIQFLLNQIDIINPVFVEFGVGDYTESNTRFLLKNNNWSGLIIDGSRKNINNVINSSITWKYDLLTECSFITKDNINQLILSHGIFGDIGLLSIDIDGNDYWVWQAIDCIQPRIVVCEYNSLFGSSSAVTVPYDEKFHITESHYSGLYWGASISAFNYIAKQKGYSLIGSNSVGNNIFFVRNDVIGNIPIYLPSDAYVKSKFKISRGMNGELSFLNFEEGFEIIKHMMVYDVEKMHLIKLQDV